MIINLSPVRSDETLEVYKQGDSITLNGVVFDLSPLPEEASLPFGSIKTEWINGEVTRVNGDIILTIKIPHSASASISSRFPSPIVNPPDGSIILPTDFDLPELMTEGDTE